MEVIIKRSSRRQKTIAARVVGEIIEITVPKGVPEAELQPHIDRLRARIERRIARESAMAKKGDDYLERRAKYLNRKYFGGTLTWHGICYSDRQEKRHGSCTPVDGTIRISTAMKDMPRWVEDYVIVHEMAHLLEPNHGRRFKAIAARYPLGERARGYLMAVDAMSRKRRASGSNGGRPG